MNRSVMDSRIAMILLGGWFIAGCGGGSVDGPCTFSITDATGKTSHRCAGGWHAVAFAGGEAEYDDDSPLSIDFSPVDFSKLLLAITMREPDGKSAIAYTPNGIGTGQAIWTAGKSFVFTIKSFSVNGTTLGNIGGIHRNISATLIHS